MNTSKVGTFRVFLGIGRNVNPVLLLHFFSLQSPLSFIILLFKLGAGFAPVAECTHSYTASKVSSVLEALLV